MVANNKKEKCCGPFYMKINDELYVGRLGLKSLFFNQKL